MLKEKCSGQQDFSLTRDDVQNLGMICGGAVQVFFRFLPAGDEATLALCEKAEELFARGADLWLLSDIGAEGRLGLYAKSCGYVGVDAPEWLTAELSRHPRHLVRDGRNLYCEQINSSGRVYVFGCGHVAQELVPVLSHVGFRCVALDDRPEFARKELFPTAEEVLLIDFTRIADFITVGEEDYACVMTRGHAFDAVVQAQMLKTPACYIGVIGSKHKKAGVFQRLREEYGFTDEDFARITTPIGLAIKAETPAEIAISIAGQMIELRARRNEA
jgi:xanthine dehydrogenase accessory factor